MNVIILLLESLCIDVSLGSGVIFVKHDFAQWLRASSHTSRNTHPRHRNKFTRTSHDSKNHKQKKKERKGKEAKRMQGEFFHGTF